VLRVVRELYGHVPAAEFGPVSLQAVRAKLIRDRKAGGLGWCRLRANKQIGRVRRCWKWAVGQELVPADLWTALTAVAGLRRGRSAARETAPVLPVPDVDYVATLPAMVPTIRAMVRLQRAAGLRPEDVRQLTPANVDRSGELWVFRPDTHKMEYLGFVRAMPLSPSAREILEPLLDGKAPGEAVFSPRQAREEMYAERRARRVCKVFPSTPASSPSHAHAGANPGSTPIAARHCASASAGRPSSRYRQARLCRALCPAARCPRSRSAPPPDPRSAAAGAPPPPAGRRPPGGGSPPRTAARRRDWQQHRFPLGDSQFSAWIARSSTLVTSSPRWSSSLVGSWPVRPGSSARSTPRSRCGGPIGRSPPPSSSDP